MSGNRFEYCGHATHSQATFEALEREQAQMLNQGMSVEQIRRTSMYRCLFTHCDKEFKRRYQHWCKYDEWLSS